MTQADKQIRSALPPNLSRRHFIQLSVVGSAMAVGGGLWLAHNSQAVAANRFANVLRIPPLLEGRDRSGRKHFDLSVQDGHTEFFEGTLTPTIGVNGSFLGPTLKFRAGDHVAIDVTNRLKFDTTLHWHGLHIPAKADGGPHQVI
ncbi:MAG: multicopper oxidase domain-containing protein, partial [Hyphomicrobiaceae bacterium]